ncbi:MAG: hypothetical protein ABIQ47_02265 [Tepidiformaceae bacterium]
MRVTPGGLVAVVTGVAEAGTPSALSAASRIRHHCAYGVPPTLGLSSKVAIAWCNPTGRELSQLEARDLPLSLFLRIIVEVLVPALEVLREPVHYLKPGTGRWLPLNIDFRAVGEFCPFEIDKSKAASFLPIRNKFLHFPAGLSIVK